MCTCQYSKTSEYLPKLKPLGPNVKVELDISNYATKENLKKEIGVDISEFPSLNMFPEFS